MRPTPGPGDAVAGVVVIEREQAGQVPVDRGRRARALPLSSTTTFGAGERSHATNLDTCSARAGSQPTATIARNSDHSLRLKA